MSRKLGRVMSSSRMITFVAFLAATFAWVLKMPALFTVSLLALVASGALYLNDKYKHSKKEKSA
ncbi:hypothetical protein [Vibrio sp. M260118]|uniref:hypothetical protein n=1 Tax=Vibrio sp. M260118 TaxID=3020896 RepID=UPI002F41FE62